MTQSQDNNTTKTAKNPTGKLPAIQFYPGDWKKDNGVQALGYFERGVWFEMLLLMSESSERGVLLLNGKPMPQEALGRLLGLDNQILTTTLTKLLDYGVAKQREDGAIYNKRMVKDEALRSIRIKAGSMGGNPNLVNQNPTTQVNQNPTPSSSSSISSSDINTGNSPQLTLMASPPPKTKKIKQKLVNLIDMSEAEIVALGKHPSPLAPKNLTRKKEELVPIDEEGEEAKVWMTLEEFNRLVLKIGEDRTSEQISSLANYICSTPEKGLKYADHYRTVLQWEKK